MSRFLCLLLFCLTGFACAQAPVSKSDPRMLEYTCEGLTLEGVLAIEPGTGQRAAVIIAHEGAGTGQMAKNRASQFAKMGYVAFAADLFGKGVAPKDRSDISKRLGDRAAIAKRLDAAISLVSKQAQVAPHKIAGVGYGLGGTAMLDLARDDGDFVGVACLHADWSARGAKPGKIACRVLALMGSEDSRASLAALTAFENEMKAAGADWDLIRYGGVAGDFSNPQAGGDMRSGNAYDSDADIRSHAAIKQFLSELFPAPAARSFAAPSSNGVAAKEAPKPVVPKGVPEKAVKVLQYVDDHDRAMDGYEGGRHFGNFEGRLPNIDRSGRRVRYREWDVNPLRPGVNRGAERLVTGSDGSAHYTDDHYSTFKKIR